MLRIVQQVGAIIKATIRIAILVYLLAEDTNLTSFFIACHISIMYTTFLTLSNHCMGPLE